MPFGSKEQKRDLRNRVLPRTSDKDGHLEDDKADLDARAMQLMGKRQQLKRNFGFVSITSFSTTVLVSWQAFAWSVHASKLLLLLGVRSLNG